jgi:hypothetical protein
MYECCAVLDGVDLDVVLTTIKAWNLLFDFFR